MLENAPTMLTGSPLSAARLRRAVSRSVQSRSMGSWAARLAGLRTADSKALRTPRNCRAVINRVHINNHTAVRTLMKHSHEHIHMTAWPAQFTICAWDLHWLQLGTMCDTCGMCEQCVCVLGDRVVCTMCDMTYLVTVLLWRQGHEPVQLDVEVLSLHTHTHTDTQTDMQLSGLLRCMGLNPCIAKSPCRERSPPCRRNCQRLASVGS